ncbi:MAG: nickel pincer cofactor biosynthesis protein LarC [Proteobacteria bacterium]|nr:nickel pincer cofactor biosynthesis protein LarC [Pseudomonadota bacterium]
MSGNPARKGLMIFCEKWISTLHGNEGLSTMRIAYFDCFSGISGNMILGALLDLGVSKDVLVESLAGLGLEPFEIQTSIQKKGFIRGTHVAVKAKSPPTHERSFREIRELIQMSRLSDKIKQESVEAFRRLAEAEGKIHGQDPEEVHFHEVGALDSIVDIVGSFVAIEALKIEAVYASRLPLGTGTVECRHGTLPVPAPATVELLRGVPVFDAQIQSELVTPTGAAWITTLARNFGRFPEMEIERVGYGVGDRDLGKVPNLLRILLGNLEPLLSQDRVMIVESDIDDMNPEFFEPLMQKLYASGALDVSLTPIQMKKNRPGVMIRAICEETSHLDIAQTILRESTSIGVRYFPVYRRKLDRRIEAVKTRYGDVRVKISTDNEGRIYHISPEYDDCSRLSSENKVSILEIYQEALLQARRREK